MHIQRYSFSEVLHSPRILIVHELPRVSWTKIMFRFTGTFWFLIRQHLDQGLFWPDYFSCEVWGEQQIVASTMPNLLAPTVNAHAWLGERCSPIVICAWLKLGCAMDFIGPCHEKLSSLHIAPSRHIPRNPETDWRGSGTAAQSHHLD